ncbi:hypothetical protein BDZ97DRAFT_2082840 [Flammula alnicola]|nr:hypothetical protein BDZ97DRAFT_2082840 [Flammula alnicola]
MVTPEEVKANNILILLLGPNDCAKTTFIKMATGIYLHLSSHNGTHWNVILINTPRFNHTSTGTPTAIIETAVDWRTRTYIPLLCLNLLWIAFMGFTLPMMRHILQMPRRRPPYSRPRPSQTFHGCTFINVSHNRYYTNVADSHNNNSRMRRNTY